MTPAEARAFADEWVAAWNAHDLERILGHYSEGVVFLSPIAAQRTGSGRVVGKARLRAYWGAALATLSDLHFEIVDVFAGFEALTIVYESRGRGRVAETVEIDGGGLVVRSAACYAP